MIEADARQIGRRDFLRWLTVAGVAFPLQSFAGGGARLPETIRVGIIGLEGHYSEITSAAKEIPNIRITAICDPNETRLKSAGRNAVFQKATVWTDYRKMLASEKFDIIGVCGENAPRAEILQACAERAPAIISEKPLTLTLKELAAVRRSIERNNTALTMLLTMRFSPPYQAMRAIVRSGEIGDVISMDAQKSYKLGERPDWMKSRKSFGGTIPYIGVHMIDLMRWISGCEFVEAAAFQAAVGPEVGEMENVATVIFRLDNKGAASLRMDYQRPAKAPSHGDDRLRIVGTKGIVEYQQQELTIVTKSDPPQKITDLPRSKSLCVDFVESLYGGPPHLITRAEIFRLSEIILKARAAAENHQIVRLKAS